MHSPLDNSKKKNSPFSDGFRTHLPEGLRRFGGPIFLIATLAYGLQDLVNTELMILLYVYALLGLAIYVPMILTDQVSLAYSAYAGIGGYAVAILSARNWEGLWGVPLGMALAGLTAYIVALATRRLSGYFLAVGTLLVAIAFGRFLIQQTDLTGGADGLTFRREIMGISISRTILLILGAVMIWLIAAVIQNLRQSDVGKGLLLMGGSRPAAESIGLNTSRFRILSLVLGGAIASLAGSLLAFSRGLVLPDSFHLELSFVILFIPLLGGKQTPWGCLVGAAVLVYVLEIARSFGPGKLLYGLGVLGCVLVVPGGILGRLGTLLSLIESGGSRRFSELSRGSPGPTGLRLSTPLEQPRSPGEGGREVDTPDAIGDQTPPNSGTVKEETKGQDDHHELAHEQRAPLVVKDISKRYGGVKALQEVSFELLNSEILGIVGPNGAGKTTLIDVLTGIQTADSGQVLLEGRILKKGAADRALAGLSRTFQHPQLSSELTVQENIRLGLLRFSASSSWGGITFQLIHSMFPSLGGRKREGAILSAREVALRIGLVHLDEEVANASFGTEKLTEIGRALVSKPPVLLMDEPFAGLGKADVDRVIDAIQRWRVHALGIIIVDHNIDLLSGICDRLLVLVSGVVIASGHPRQVLAEPHVRKAYFGGD